VAKRHPATLDLFAAPADRHLVAEWPEANRFPLNRSDARVEDTVLKDLRSSAQPLIVTGFATLDRLIDFVASADQCSEIRIVFGSEPFESRRDTFSIRELDLPHEMKEYWLGRGISIRLSAKLLLCIERLKAGTLNARYIARSTWRLHAKLYVGANAATLGSSNFTDPGLRNQLESNVRFRRYDEPVKPAHKEEHQRFLETSQIAEQFWDLGTDYNQQLIALLEQLLRLVPWEEALARASAELLEAEWAKRFLRGEYLPGDAALWPSQRLGIAQALFILKERGSVLIADATGSGKTRAGTHLIGAKMHEIIASNRLRRGKALLIAPPTVVNEWKEESAIASVPLDVYSHGMLSYAKGDSHGTVLKNLRRAQILCVDEGHNFLNFNSNRTQQLLRNMADHVALFTATPINRSPIDLLRIADMLGADNLDDATLKAFDRMLGARSISRALTEDEITELRREIAKFTVRRTKRVLNQLIDKNPSAYTDANGRQCRFPKHKAKTYALNESPSDRSNADKIRELAGQLKGVLYFQKDIALPKALARRGLTEEKFLQGRLRGANRLAQYSVMAALRSSRAALYEHLVGTTEAAARSNLIGFQKAARSGNVLKRLSKFGGRIPKSRLSIELPEWLSDAEAHRAACADEIVIYNSILNICASISAKREHAKVQLLAKLSKKYAYILAFDSRPITLAYIGMLLDNLEPGPRILIATGDTKSDRKALLKSFSPKSDDQTPTIGLCSDSVSEGVNLQRGQAIVHLDMPSVVRIAEQRSGRIDRLDSPHKTIYALWPDDATEFALRSDERFIERYETVDNLLGSNMPLPDSIRERKDVHTAKDAIREFETIADSWDGVDDAFSPVRELVSGDSALIPEQTYQEYIGVKARVTSRVSLVSAVRSWAFFCTTDASTVPRWIFLRNLESEPETDLRNISTLLRERLGPETKDLREISPSAEKLLEAFLLRLSSVERLLLSRRKRRALDEMEIILDSYLVAAAVRKDQGQIEVLSALLRVLREPNQEIQPDWEELAARWLDLIRPVWYEKLQERRRRKPLLLKDIRKDLQAAEQVLLPQIIEQFTRTFPAQRPVDERIVSCILGVSAVRAN
jgi:SNF2-related domain/Helicase conserved C-terminal domain